MGWEVHPTEQSMFEDFLDDLDVQTYDILRLMTWLFEEKGHYSWQCLVLLRGGWCALESQELAKEHKHIRCKPAEILQTQQHWCIHSLSKDHRTFLWCHCYPGTRQSLMRRPRENEAERLMVLVFVSKSLCWECSCLKHTQILEDLRNSHLVSLLLMNHQRQKLSDEAVRIPSRTPMRISIISAGGLWILKRRWGADRWPLKRFWDVELTDPSKTQSKDIPSRCCW